MLKKINGETKKMAYPRVAFWPHYSLTSTQMTNHQQKIHKDYFMRMTFASPPEKNLLKWLNSIFVRHYHNNRQKSNPAKTQSCLFHLRNHHATSKTNVIWNETPISHDKCHVYFGVIMDRTLSFKEHTRKLKAKI